LPFCHRLLRGQKPKSLEYPKQLNTLGEHIRKRRFGLFQKQLAGQIGVDETTVYNWERNATSPQIHVSPQVIKFLGYDPAPIPQSDSERLVTAGKAKGLTQKEMAKRIGVNPTTLARWERGKCQRSEKFRRIVSFWFPGGPDLPRMPAIKLQRSG
jgi:DNA-binding XRE family transcriptional regulator